MSAISQKSIYTHRVEDEANLLEPHGAVIDFPENAEDFSVTARGNKVEIHALVDLTSSKISQKFYLRATGLPLDGNEGEYIGTISLFNGYFVGHLFKAHPSISSPINSKKVIYKYPLVDGDESKVILPEGALKICTFVRREKPYVYAVVDLNRHSADLPY